ncbi:MAG: GNAT family N-acetyltransferase [Candidatus Thorarchaeota archaeon]
MLSKGEGSNLTPNLLLTLVLSLGYVIRDLELSDMEQVNDICSTTWGGNDYIPEVLPHWIESPENIVRGLFEKELLLSICTLQIVTSKERAYISGLRARDKRRREGHGRDLAVNLISTARERNLKHLLYLTMNTNEASAGFAENLGFSVLEKYGSFHLFTPFTPHPTPSPVFIPVTVKAERLMQVIDSSPTLVPTHFIPFDFQFYEKTLANLQSISENTDFRLVIDEDGQPGGLYYGSPLREDRGEKRTVYVVYTTNRTIFVDMMARIIDESESRGATRVTFLMGPNATQWVNDLGYTDSELGAWPGDHSKRRLLLYEFRLEEERS